MPRLGRLGERLAFADYSLVVSLATILFRVLLCLGLVANGSAQAMAIAHSMPVSQHVRAATTPCHEANGRMAAGQQAQERHAAPVTKSPDCCKPGACDCACSHGAVATMPLLRAEGRALRHAAFVGVAATRYASPALPRLIRPPIV